MKVSIIIPVAPGGEVRALASLRASSALAGLYEVLVAEGRQPSRQRNQAAAAAEGGIIYFLDDDSMVVPDFLDLILAQYHDPRVAAVGGPSLTPATDTLLQKSIALALSSRIGGGAMRNRYRQTGSARATSDHELILCNLSFRRETFIACGGLDERLYPNEENELLERLSEQGRLLVHDPALAVRRSQRGTIRQFIRQFFTYGRGRGEQTLLTGKVRPATLAPLLLVIYLCTLPLLAKPVYYLPLLCYAITIIIASIGAAFAARLAGAFIRLSLLFPLLHLAYGAGLLVGLLRPRYKGKKRDSEVIVSKVKGFGDEEVEA